MGFDLQISNVVLSEFDKDIDAAVKRFTDDPVLSDEEKASLAHAVAYVKTVVDKVGIAPDSKVYCAIAGSSGLTAEGTQNWLNIAITETEKGTAKAEPPLVPDGATSPWYPPSATPPFTPAESARDVAQIYERPPYASTTVDATPRTQETTTETTSPRPPGYTSPYTPPPKTDEVKTETTTTTSYPRPPAPADEPNPF